MNRFFTLLWASLVFAASAQAQQASPVGPDDRAAVVQANNAFAVELYSHLRSQSGNLFFSPESISTALAMTYAGARGETAREMAKTLHFTLPPDKLHPAMGELLRDINAPHDGYQLKVANALWAQQGYAFLNGFLNLTRDDYSAALQQVDFKNATEQARLTINSWVEQQTASKIKDLIQMGMLNQYTRLVLTNAVYFKGNWQTQFEKDQTQQEDFYVTPTQHVRVRIMHCTGSFNYLDGEGGYLDNDDRGPFQALEMPYKGKELSMIVLLPNAVDGLLALEQSLTPARVEKWLSKLRPAYGVQLTMPKFRMTMQSRLESALSAMGMRHAFGESRADFSRMADSQGNKELSISAVIHKAYVDVDEEGTEATAATATVMVAPPPFATPARRPPVFRADHPFLFMIWDNRSRGILFMGRVADPSE